MEDMGFTKRQAESVCPSHFKGKCVCVCEGLVISNPESAEKY